MGYELWYRFPRRKIQRNVLVRDIESKEEDKCRGVQARVNALEGLQRALKRHVLAVDTGETCGCSGHWKNMVAEDSGKNIWLQ